MKLPIQFVCGSSDNFYGYATASESFLSQQGHATRLSAAQGVGHSFSGVLQKFPASELWGWMESAAP